MKIAPAEQVHRMKAALAEAGYPEAVVRETPHGCEVVLFDIYMDPTYRLPNAVVTKAAAVCGLDWPTWKERRWR